MVRLGNFDPSNGTSGNSESRMAYLPGLHVDEIGLTGEKYIPVNGSVELLQLRISFDSHDGEGGCGYHHRLYRGEF